MTPNEYQELAMRTCIIPYSDKESMMRHSIFGLASEAGEVCGIYQKEYQGHEIDTDHVIKELGDCLWMIAEACSALEINMEDAMEINIKKLRERYPDGFSSYNSLHRKKGDI